MYVNKKYYICRNDMIMEKVIRLVNILDDDIIDKLVMLDRLVRFYSRFLKMWKKVEVTSDGRVVRVKFSTMKHGYESFTERIFPMDKIEERICSYKIKIRKELNQRHDNPRLKRATDIRQWKNYINNAEI